VDRLNIFPLTEPNPADSLGLVKISQQTEMLISVIKSIIIIIIIIIIINTGNSITFPTNCNYRIAATLYTLET
jgi:hypothetical protein